MSTADVAIAKEGVLALPVAHNKVRMITHHDVSREAVEQALERIDKVVRRGVAEAAS
jgi:threonine aldolase